MTERESATTTNSVVRVSGVPLPVSTLIGRSHEIEHLQRLLKTVRLLTVTGPGGMGKTRLALELGRLASVEDAEAAKLVDLAPLADPNLVAQTVASTVGLREQPGRALMTTLTEALRSQRLLLIMDNCEHLVQACAELANQLLSNCPELRILATSRAPLGVPGEVSWPVPALGPNERVQLFVERARAVRPEFALNQGNAARLADICRRLDGLPLAIELAAARITVLTVDDIAARLEDRFRLLRTSSRMTPARHQTLLATIRWSYDLLSKTERLLLDRLTIFAGGWTLEAAEAACSGDGILSSQVVDLLGSLVDQSLVLPVAANARFAMLDSVRQFGRERLIERHELDLVAERHARYFVRFAERAEQELLGPREPEALDALDGEHDNIRTALHWLVTQGKSADAQRLAGAMGLYWFFRSSLSEGRRWLDHVLSMSDGTALTPQRARCLFAAADITMAQGDYLTSRRLSQESLALWRALGNDRQAAAALYMVGQLTRILGDYAAADVVLRDAAAVGESSANIYYAALSLIALADMSTAQGDLANALRRAEAAKARALKAGRPRVIVHALRSLADVRFELGDLAAAAALAAEAIARARHELLSPWWLVLGLLSSAKVALAQREFERARSVLVEELALSRDIGEKWGIAAGLEECACLVAACGQVRRAVVLAGAAAATRSSLSGALFPASGRLRRQLDASLSGALSSDVRRIAWREGEALHSNAAVEYALASIQSAASAAVRPADVLTPREREVARLVAQGLSNREVAERLVLTEKTTANHVGRIFEKLGVQSRSQLAARAAEFGLANRDLGNVMG